MRWLGVGLSVADRVATLPSSRECPPGLVVSLAFPGLFGLGAGIAELRLRFYSVWVLTPLLCSPSVFRSAPFLLDPSVSVCGGDLLGKPHRPWSLVGRLAVAAVVDFPSRLRRAASLWRRPDRRFRPHVVSWHSSPFTVPASRSTCADRRTVHPSSRMIWYHSIAEAFPSTWPASARSSALPSSPRRHSVGSPSASSLCPEPLSLSPMTVLTLRPLFGSYQSSPGGAWRPAAWSNPASGITICGDVSSGCPPTRSSSSSVDFDCVFFGRDSFQRGVNLLVMLREGLRSQCPSSVCGRPSVRPARSASY